MLRRLIIRSFEFLCIASVILPVAGIIWAFFRPDEQQAELTFGIMVTALMLSVLLAGGALTLAEIAHNTKDAMEALRNIERNTNGTLRAGSATSPQAQ